MRLRLSVSKFDMYYRVTCGRCSRIYYFYPELIACLRKTKKMPLRHRPVTLGCGCGETVEIVLFESMPSISAACKACGAKWTLSPNEIARLIGSPSDADHEI